MNKFEQVSSDDYKMSLVGAWIEARRVPMSHEGKGVAGGCKVRSNASRIMVIWGSPSPLWTD